MQLTAANLIGISSTSESHMDASRSMLERADKLIAVWDGVPARGYGGTADVVHLASDLGLDVTIIWPAGRPANEASRRLRGATASP